MTTQNTDHEQHDVDASVVEHPHASEATPEFTASQTEQVDSVQGVAETATAATEASFTPEPSSSADTTTSSEEVTEQEQATFTPPIMEETSLVSPSTHEQEAREDSSSEEIQAQPADSAPVAEVPAHEEAPSQSLEIPTEIPESTAVESAQPETGDVSSTPVEDEGEKPVETEPVHPYDIFADRAPEPEVTRSFTELFEEFRQAEASRRPTLPEPEVDNFNLLTSQSEPSDVPPAEEAPVASEQEVSPAEQEIFQLLESGETVVPEVETSTPGITAESGTSAGEQQQEETSPMAEQETLLTQEQQRKEQENEVRPPVERTVSPLLRPAHRLRLPRHGGARHLREQEITPPETQTQEPATPAAQATPTVETPAATEAPAQPKPARRYRFDRPSTSSSTKTNKTESISAATTPPAPSTPRAEEQPRERESAQSRNGHHTAAARVEQQQQSQPAETAASAPVASAKHHATSETPVAAVETQSKSAPAAEPVQLETAPVIELQEHGRRRKERESERHSQKEQAAASASTQQNTTSTVPTPESTSQEASSMAEAIAPEDLPPLEYAELQRATSRRRRRHRGSTGNGGTAHTETPAAIQPPAPAPQPSAPTPVPAPTAPETRTPAASTNNAPYSIISGYTLSQMNQGNDVAGPFMGPDPSPARGSVLSRDGRTTARAEGQQRIPSFQQTRAATPNAEAAPSSAMINHFANVISQTIQQSIQLQTDRMVTEMRRSNQAPTSVSVSLPPFPSTERVGVFVDVANLLYSARTLRIGVDFGKLLDFLRGNRRLVRAQAYCPTSPQASDEQMFLQAVKGLGYRITTKNYKTFSSGAKKADLDLDLCMDVVRLVEGRAVDCIVLVSGDSDFMPMLDYCSDHGVRVEVAAFDEAMSATLRQSCDLFINLSLLEEIRA